MIPVLPLCRPAGALRTEARSVSYGADVIQQYMNVGVVDELKVALAPDSFCGGRRFFQNKRKQVSHKEPKEGRKIGGALCVEYRLVRINISPRWAGENWLGLVGYKHTAAPLGL